MQEIPKEYEEVDARELGPGGEQKKWEEEKLVQALIKYGAKDAKSKKVRWFLVERIVFSVFYCGASKSEVIV